MVQLLWKPIQWFLKKLKIELPSDPAIPVLGIQTKDLKAESWKGICTPMFIAELYTRAKRQRQPKCPLMDKEKVVCIYNHSALKRKEILVHATSETWGHYTKWNKPVTKKKKKNHCIIPRMWGIHMNSFWKLEPSHHMEEPKLACCRQRNLWLVIPISLAKAHPCERGCGGPRGPAHSPPNGCLNREPRRDQHKSTQLSSDCVKSASLRGR